MAWVFRPSSRLEGDDKMLKLFDSRSGKHEPVIAVAGSPRPSTNLGPQSFRPSFCPACCMDIWGPFPGIGRLPHFRESTPDGRVPKLYKRGFGTRRICVLGLTPREGPQCTKILDPEPTSPTRLHGGALFKQFIAQVAKDRESQSTRLLRGVRSTGAWQCSSRYQCGDG